MKKTLREHFLSTLDKFDEDYMSKNGLLLHWFNRWLDCQEVVWYGEAECFSNYHTKEIVSEVVIDYQKRYFKSIEVYCKDSLGFNWEDFYFLPEDCVEVYPKEIKTVVYLTEEHF